MNNPDPSKFYMQIAHGVKAEARADAPDIEVPFCIAHDRWPCGDCGTKHYEGCECPYCMPEEKLPFCKHVYARRMSGERVCVKCTSPKPPLDEAVIRELNNGLRAMNAIHQGDKRFDVTIVRGADSGMTMLEVMAEALDELELRRHRG